jgi:hypothetical protein
LFRPNRLSTSGKEQAQRWINLSDVNRWNNIFHMSFAIMQNGNLRHHVVPQCAIEE